MQLGVLLISLALMGVVAAFFIAAVRASGEGGADSGSDRRRVMLIWSLLAFGIVVTIASLWRWPYAITTSGEATTVNATGKQWFWEIDKSQVASGKPIVFNVHAGDVTHGLGVVDPSGRLLFQTQAMPGYVNKVEYTFETPGTYKIVCLEYCGVAHHAMNAELEVTAK